MAESVHERLEREGRESKAKKAEEVAESQTRRSGHQDTPEARRGRRYDYFGDMLITSPRKNLGRYAAPRHTADGRWKQP